MRFLITLSLVLLGQSVACAADWSEQGVVKEPLYTTAAYKDEKQEIVITFTYFKAQGAPELQQGIQDKLKARIDAGEGQYYGNSQTKLCQWPIVRFVARSSKYPIAATMLIVVPLTATQAMVVSWENPVPQLKVDLDWNGNERGFLREYNTLLARFEKLL